MAKRKRDLLNAVLRSNFEAFIERVFQTLQPSATYFPSWYVSAIAHALTEVAEGRSTRLALCLPPRHLKSICASVALPAWLLGRDPTRCIICVSYSEELAKKHARDCRLIMESIWYRDLFPHTRLSRRKNTELELTTTRNGYRLTTSIGGTLTGRGADLMIIDDPIKATDCESKAARGGVNEWYSAAALNRLNNKATGAVIITMHRLHEDDLVGHAIERADFTMLSLPAIAEEDAQIPIGPKSFHFRRAGTPLCAERESLEILEKVKKEMGSRAFSAQYQQSPMPAEGNHIKEAWLKTYEMLPKDDHMRIIHSWDIATSTRETADYTVGTIWGMTNNRNYYLLDVIRGRWEMPDVKRKILATADMHRPEAVLIEEASLGLSLIQELRREDHRNFIGCKPERDKESRVLATLTTFEAGKVHLPKEAPWLAEYKHELFGFPSTKHDDQVDSTVQYLTWAVKRQGDVVVPLSFPNLTQRSIWDMGDGHFLERPSWMIQDLTRRW